MRGIEVMPSIITCCLGMGWSHASHISPAAGPPHNLRMLSNGRRPSRSFTRTRTRIASCMGLRLRLPALLIPEGEALDMHLNRLLDAVGPGNALDHERMYDQSATGVAFFTIAWTDPKPRDAVQRQIAVLKFLTDERTNRSVFHGLASRRIGGEKMPDSP